VTVKIQVRRGTATQWDTADPTLSAGELGYETNTGKFKVGNGTDVWSDLEYFVDSADIATLISGAALDNTDDLSEGLVNKYHTIERVYDALDSGALQNINISYNAGAQSIDISVPTVQGTEGSQGTQGTQGVQGIQGTQGVQGVQGVQGIQGVQGTQGVQGPQGTQGVQGLEGFVGSNGAQGTEGTQGAQGTQGTQGVQGTEGAQGAVGSQGTQGVTGRDGNFGGATFAYSYETSFPNEVHEDFPNGILGFDNTTLTSATELFISFFDADSVSSEGFLQTIDDSDSAIKGNFKVYEASTPANYAFFAIIGAHDNGLDNHFHVPVAYISGSVTSFTDEDNLEITFARTGDTGDTGAQGTEGTQGTQGTDGTQGVQGTQGTQGVQGTEGTQGTQGTLGTQGATGAQGVQGTEGIQGVQGTEGIQGVQGSLGVQGTIGSESANPTVTVLLFGGM
jgi:hypothetical protein